MKWTLCCCVVFACMIGGGTLLYAKWHCLEESASLFLHDRPILCEGCGTWMWHGEKAHVCSDAF